MLVKALKSFRAGSGASLVRPGDEVEVDDEFGGVLLDRGIAVVAGSAAVEAAADSEVPDDEAEDAAGESEDPEAAEEVEVSSSYPSIPNKTAPVSEWEEYARINKISLTGLRNRNEKMGYIQKVVSGE